MADERFTSGVNGMDEEKLASVLRLSIQSVEPLVPPRTGICVFLFDMGAGETNGIGYISNAQRASMTLALKEWLRIQETRS